MDQSKFDALTKGLASGANRRRVLGGLAGSLTTILGVGGLTALDADAKNKKKKKNDKKKCGKGKKRCGKHCADLTKSNKHCGACGNKCATGQKCVDSACQCGGDTCDGCCDGQTCQTGDSNDVCGTKGGICVKCTGGQACDGGACVCPQGLDFCNGDCVDTKTDAANCGACGVKCGDGGACQNGVCSVALVSPKQMSGWTIRDNEPDGKTNGSVDFVTAADAPLGQGSVELSTPNETDKATLVNATYDKLAIADIANLKYSTFMQNGSGTGVVVPAIKLPVTSTAVSFTTLIYEPAYDTSASVVADTWQSWDLIADSARWWSSRDVPDGQGGFYMCNPNGANASTAACNGKLYVPWSTVKEALPDATITGGLLLETGSGSPGAVGNVDKVIVNGTTYDFEPKP